MSDFAEGMRVQRELEDANQTQLMHFYDGLSQEDKLTLEDDCDESHDGVRTKAGVRKT